MMINMTTLQNTGPPVCLRIRGFSSILLCTLFVFFSLSCTGGDDSGRQSAEEVLKKAEGLLLEGREADALSLLEKQEGPLKKNPLLTLLAGKIYFFRGNYEKAGSLFRSTIDSSLKKKNDFQAGSKWLARALIFQGSGAEAESILLASLRQDPEDPELLILLGKARRLEGDLKGAIEAYIQATLFSEYLAESYIDLADMYRTYGLKEKMRTALIRAEALLSSEHPLAKPLASLIRSLEKETIEAETIEEEQMKEQTVEKEEGE